jgi:hypothetical protein
MPLKIENSRRNDESRPVCMDLRVVKISRLIEIQCYTILGENLNLN